ncbi:MAG: NAD(P) transhydrogenase subunit alpha [Kiritimatiellia bacterium]|nr:NAD(P) transhydrogenase subunit alpha [Kiritimatiellia bacterium]
MIVTAIKENEGGETRAALTPDAVRKLVGLGVSIRVESGLGEAFGATDELFLKAGAEVVADAAAALQGADLFVHIRPPRTVHLNLLKPGAITLGFLDPFRNRAGLEELARRNGTALCLETIPRTTLAQKMDALSSQASLAGYVSVLLGASRLPKLLPMMMTPAGTISPARVLVIGAGVAGLQAIATARRLGARVEAYDTRPAAEEQIRSLGAKAVKLDIGETGEAGGGYARELTPEQLERQRASLAKHCSDADLIITTAQVFGRPAPRILTAEMIAGMRPGSVVIDLAAAEDGSNVEGVRPDEEVTVRGVRLIGGNRLSTQVPETASRMLAANVANFIEQFWDRKNGVLDLEREDEILAGAMVVRGGKIVHPLFRKDG